MAMEWDADWLATADAYTTDRETERDARSDAAAVSAADTDTDHDALCDALAEPSAFTRLRQLSCRTAIAYAITSCAKTPSKLTACGASMSSPPYSARS
jgi:hypothetical protein